MFTKRIKSKIEVLKEAGPWIKQFRDKIFVIKPGGEILSNEENITNLVEAVLLLAQLGIRVVIVHGGGPQLDKRLREKGIEFKRINGVRVYTEEILEEARSTFNEIVNDLCRMLEKSGLEPHFIQPGEIKLNRIEELGLVGEVLSVDEDLFKSLLKANIVPLISPFGVSPKGKILSVNADNLAASIAQILKAEKLIIATSVEGVKDDKGKVIRHLALARAK